MGLLRDIHAALREGLDDLLNAGSGHDDIEEVTGLLESDLAEARTELDTARDEARRLAARVEGERRSADRLHEQAQAAVEQNDDEQGRELIRKRRRVLRGVEILEQQQTEHRQMIELLRDHIETLEDKLQELRLRSDYLRTRNRVQSLRERFERYLREYGLAEIPSLEESLADAELSGRTGTGGDVRCAWCGKPQQQVERMFAGPDGLHLCSDCVTHASEQLHEPEAPPADDERVVPEGPLTPRRRRQRLESDEGPEPAPLPRGGRAEVPGEPEPEPALRRREPEDEPEPEPRRSTRAERESLLRDIERRQRGPEFEAELEDELARMKAAAAQRPAPAGAADGEAAAPEPPADDADQPARKTEPPPAEDEHGGEQ